MNTKRRLLARLALTATLAAVALAPVAPVAAGDEGDLRGMKLGRFVSSRPRARKHRPGAQSARYRRKGAAVAAASTAEVGLTIWRLRPPTEGDPVAMREILHHGGSGARGEVAFERVGGGAPLEVGERFRLVVETPHRGYLYVINRSEYAGAETREPYLIFPTALIRQGNNMVQGGRLFEIPARSDDPPYFEIGGGPGLVAEEVIIVVAPEPLDVSTAPDRAALPADRVAEWERRWGSPAETLEMVGGDGRGRTRAEAEAAQAPDRLLDREDPLPQTIYRVAAKPGSPIFLRVRIPIARAAR